MNSKKHGILNSDMSMHDKIKVEEVKDSLCADFKPNSSLEAFVVERIAVHIVKLKRITKAETGYINNYSKGTLISIDLDGKEKHLGTGSITKLLETYSRYETAEENRFYRAINELQKLQNK